MTSNRCLSGSIYCLNSSFHICIQGLAFLDVSVILFWVHMVSLGTSLMACVLSFLCPAMPNSVQHCTAHLTLHSDRHSFNHMERGARALALVIIAQPTPPRVGSWDPLLTSIQTEEWTVSLCGSVETSGSQSTSSTGLSHCLRITPWTWFYDLKHKQAYQKQSNVLRSTA